MYTLGNSPFTKTEGIDTEEGVFAQSRNGIPLEKTAGPCHSVLLHKLPVDCTDNWWEQTCVALHCATVTEGVALVCRLHSSCVRVCSSHGGPGLWSVASRSHSRSVRVVVWSCRPSAGTQPVMVGERGHYVCTLWAMLLVGTRQWRFSAPACTHPSTWWPSMRSLQRKSGYEFLVSTLSLWPLPDYHTSSGPRSDVGIRSDIVNGCGDQRAALWQIPDKECAALLPGLWRLYAVTNNSDATSGQGSSLL